MDTISLYKHRIDALMDLIYGSGQANHAAIIEQLNYLLFLRALSIKDDEAELLGITDESEKIFTGDLVKYRWQNLLALNAEDLFKTLEQAFELLQKKSSNATVKLLFRNAHVKIYDRPTLRRVVHEIEEFAKELDKVAHHGDKDVFGDMYEYLLSKLSSAGTNGQFRTPRHIIDFMVKVVDPKKNETILDPACGTAGFLVAAYRYIAGEYTSDKMKKAGSPRAMDKLSADEKKFLFNHMFTGFDSDEDMIKFGMMNLHLHGLTKSYLVRQNSLTDTTGNKDKFDVILANPPFAGKIDEESVSEDLRMGTKATELLFLRFMMDHLSFKGKLAVIVPEGVVFNASKAHTKVRQMLLEKGLWAVVSLPSGVFNPYAGVKTSILFLDKEIAKNKNEIVFVKIENDGFDLGAQRRPIDKNDLPVVTDILNAWKSGKEIESNLVNIVEKSKIESDENYGLSGDRYKATTDHSVAKWPMVELGEILEYEQPTKYIVKSVDYKDEYETPVLTAGKTFILGNTNETEGVFRNRLPVIIFDDFTTATKFVDFPFKVKSSAMKILHAKKEVADPRYVYFAMQNITFKFAEHKRFWISEYSKIRIPLPPLEVQKQIVAEFDGYQKIIDGAKQVVENWKPRIEIDPLWEKVKFGDEKVMQIIDGDRGTNYPNKEAFKPEGYCLFLNTSNVRKGSFDFSKCDFITKAKDELLRKGKLVREDIVLTTRGTLGNSAYYSGDIPFENIRINSGMVLLRANSKVLLPEYLLQFLNSQEFVEQVTNFMSGSAQPQLPIRALSEIQFSLPPLDAQKQIIKQIKTERSSIEVTAQLISIFEQKIKDRLAKLWLS
ncbi:MAG: N-6 DNA methylase [Candidatus Paceibacter sp.]|nr:N-6 DNA methylase [Candidatus Paceibacter sp.]